MGNDLLHCTSTKPMPFPAKAIRLLVQSQSREASNEGASSGSDAGVRSTQMVLQSAATLVGICRSIAWTLAACACALLSACIATGPQTRILTVDSFALVTVESEKALDVDGVTLKDLGETKNLIEPVEVQDCAGGKLRYERVTRNGVPYDEPVWIFVDPLERIYVRRFRVTNNTTTTLNISRADAVLVDAAGNDNEMATAEILRQNVLARYPCSSGPVIARTLRPLKLLGSDIRIRPGRSVTLYAMFPNADISILGDWFLEINDFPVQTDDKGQVSKVAQFKFDLTAKGYRTTITQEKESLLTGWVEVGRTTEELTDN